MLKFIISSKMVKSRKSKSVSRPNFPNNRKILRKQKRQEKKAKRQEHYLKKKPLPEQGLTSPGKFVKRPVDAVGISHEHKKKKQKLQPSSLDIIGRQRQKELKEADLLKSEMEQQRNKLLLDANAEEDKVIKKLEKQLGMNKIKNKRNLFSDDGLDYLLEICDRATSEQIVAAEKHLANVEDQSDFEDDLAAVTGKEIETPKHKKKKTEDKNESPNHRGIDDDFSENDEDNISDGEGELSIDEDDLVDSDDDISEGVSGEEPEESVGTFLKNKHVNSQSNSKSKDSKNENIKLNIKRSSHKVEESCNEESDEELDNPFSEDEVSHLSDDDEVNDKPYNSDDVSKVKEKSEVWEDIYGRKRDKEGNVIKEEKGIYIPPHLRNKDSGSDKELAQLKRQIKSVLNKLSGSNLHWACNSVEGLFGLHSRHAVNSSLCALWVEALLGPAATPDRMVAEHAAMLAVLHANVGQEIGAHFLQELSKMFDEMLLSTPSNDKRLDNLVSCLAHLYSFKLYHANLAYDILRRLLEELTEKNIECILVALRCVGGVLRKEEPVALKTFIHDAQARVADITETAAAGSRIKFLLEVLMAVKNNNLTKIPSYDPSYTEHLKKQIRGIIRKGNYITPLNIRLEDLLKADERGKWWVVGSAWEGTRVTQEEKPAAVPLPTTDQKLLELARRQRMNTDVRRSIFCVIMAAEDYMDAFEKLQHLGLKGQQQREIVHVLLACCLQERRYNPYYGVLALHLCHFDRKYQLSIQYAVWDRIKDIDNQSKQELSNLAQFLTHLLMEKGLPLSVLKVIQFSDLNKSSVKFMRQILLAIIMNEDVKASLEVFHRIAKSPKLHTFRESLRLFIQHFLVRSGKKANVVSDEDLEVMKLITTEIDRLLTMHESKMLF